MKRALSLSLLLALLATTTTCFYFYPFGSFFGNPFFNPNPYTTTTTETTDADGDTTTTTTRTYNPPVCNSYVKMLLVPGVCGCCSNDGMCLNIKRAELKVKLDRVCAANRSSLQAQQTALDAAYYSEVLACHLYIKSQLDRWYLLFYRISGCIASNLAPAAPAVQYTTPAVQYTTPVNQYTIPRTGYPVAGSRVVIPSTHNHSYSHYH